MNPAVLHRVSLSSRPGPLQTESQPPRPRSSPRGRMPEHPLHDLDVGPAADRQGRGGVALPILCQPRPCAYCDVCPDSVTKVPAVVNLFEWKRRLGEYAPRAADAGH
jgi:hypothetical protein